MGGFLNRRGYSEDDVRSIVQLFACCFTGMDVAYRDKKHYHYLMMKFISQRFDGFVGWLGRKIPYTEDAFDGRTASAVAPIDSSSPGQPRDIENSYLHAYDPEVAYEVGTVNIAEKLEDLEDLVDRAENNLISAKLWGDKDEITQARILLDKATACQSAVKKVKVTEDERQSELSKTLRATLDRDPGRYREQLCFYATYRGTSYDVRRAARSACKRYGIDYVKWVSDKEGLAPGHDEVYSGRYTTR
jgi:hypothetical protein